MAPRLAPPLIVVNDENESKVYTYGNTISGVVKADTSSPITLGVVVSLKAETSSCISVPSGRSSHTYASKILLLNDTIELYPGDDISSSASAEGPFVSLPFTFTFPSKVALSVPDSRRFQSSATFEHLPGHALPPTFKLLQFWGEFQEIVYYLEARMVLTPSRKRREKKKAVVRHSLAFSPPCTDPSWASQPRKPETVSLTRRSRWLHDDAPHERHGFGSYMRKGIKRSSDPTATFTITTNVPTVARAGYTLPVTVSLAHGSHSDSLRARASISLRGFRVVLRWTMYMRVRDPRTLDDKDHRKFELMQWRWKGKHNSGARPPPVLPADGEELALVEFCHNRGVVPTKEVAPTFKTYNLATTHEVRVRLRVECAGKTFKVDTKVPVTILGWPDAGAEEAVGNP